MVTVCLSGKHTECRVGDHDSHLQNNPEKSVGVSAVSMYKDVAVCRNGLCKLQEHAYWHGIGSTRTERGLAIHFGNGVVQTCPRGRPGEKRLIWTPWGRENLWSSSVLWFSCGSVGVTGGTSLADLAWRTRQLLQDRLLIPVTACITQAKCKSSKGSQTLYEKEVDLGLQKTIGVSHNEGHK